MYYANHLFLGFLMSFIGVTLPGMVNMTTVSLSVKRGLKEALWFNFGASLTVFVQAFIAVAFATYLSDHPEIFNFLKKAAVVLLLILSIVFFYQALRSKAATASKQKGSSFLIGIVVASMNVLTIPYFFAFSAFLEAHNLIFTYQPFRVIFGMGAMVGAFLMLGGYARFAQFVAKRTQTFARNVNLIISGLFLLLAVLQLAEIYST